MEPEYYTVIESSFTVEEKDLVRAIDHARIIRHVTWRQRSYPVVARVRLERRSEIVVDAARDRKMTLNRVIQAGEPDSAYWRRLDSADLRPDETR